MDKFFVLDYLSPCFIKLGVVGLIVFFVLFCNHLSRMKRNGSMYNANCNVHLNFIFRGKQVFCVVLQKKCCSDHLLV